MANWLLESDSRHLKDIERISSINKQKQIQLENFLLIRVLQNTVKIQKDINTKSA